MTNLLLHVVNTLLVFLLLRSLTGNTGPSWVVAALFGWHPLHVESVAWIAEQKDLLSTLCLLGSLCTAPLPVHAKAHEIDTQNPRREGRSPAWRYYGMALGVSAAGLMCKPMLVTLPCLLLLLDYWPLQRIVDSPANRAGQNWVLVVRIEKSPVFRALRCGLPSDSRRPERGGGH